MCVCVIWERENICCVFCITIFGHFTWTQLIWFRNGFYSKRIGYYFHGILFQHAAFKNILIECFTFYFVDFIPLEYFSTFFVRYLCLFWEFDSIINLIDYIHRNEHIHSTPNLLTSFDLNAAKMLTSITLKWCSPQRTNKKVDFFVLIIVSGLMNNRRRPSIFFSKVQIVHWTWSAHIECC